MPLILGVVAVSLLLLAQQQPQKIPPAAVSQVPPQPPTVTLEANPTSTSVNSPVVFTARIAPPVAGIVRYEFHVDGPMLPECSGSSPTCTWIPLQPGEHTVHVEVRISGRGGRANPVLISQRQPFTVQPEVKPPPEPTATPKPDSPPGDVIVPSVVLKLATPNMVAGQPTSFAVTLENASPFVYVINMGDGTAEQTRTEAEFTYVYQQPGPYTVVARFPDSVTPLAESALTVTVGAAVSSPPDPGTTSVPRPPTPPPPTPLWLYVLVGVLVGAALTVAIARVAKKHPERPNVAAVPTFNLVPPRRTAFHPQKMKGVSLEIRFVRNLGRIRFAPRVRIHREN